MRFKVQGPFKGQTETGELELRPGQVVKLSPSIEWDKALAELDATLSASRSGKL